MLMDQHLLAQQAQQGPPGAGAGVPNLPPHLMQPGYHPQQAQQALLSEQQAALEMFQRQQAQQQGGYYPGFY